MFKRWSLSARLVSTVAVTTAIALLLFAGLTGYRLQAGAARQTEAVTTLARERYEAQLQLEVQLASSFLERIAHDADVAVAGLAERSETYGVIKRGNIVAIDLLMQKAVRNGPLDGVLVLGTGLNPLGSHQPGLDLLTANKLLAESPYRKTLRQLLEDQDVERLRSYKSYQSSNAAFVRAMGLAFEPNSLLILSAHPVFDDFGDVAAVVLGLRIVSDKEEILQQFARSWDLIIHVRDGGKVILESGHAHGLSDARDLLSQCAPFVEHWEICVGSPREKLEAQAQKLVTNIEQEKASVMWWLAALGLSSLLFAALLASVVTRRVLAPLENITRVVRSVAKGNWLARVAGQKRRDEVGEIARAVVVLQRSVKEREQLQASVVDVDQVLQQRRDLTEAMQSCRSVLRQRLIGLSDLTERVDEGAQQLVSLSGLAEGEADEARLIALRAIPKEVDAKFESSDDRSRFVRDGIERLGETVARIGSSGREVAEDVNALVVDVRGLDHVVKRFLGDMDAVPELPEARSSAKALEEA